MKKFRYIFLVGLIVLTVTSVQAQEIDERVSAQVDSTESDSTEYSTEFIDDIELEVPTLEAAWAPVDIDHSVGFRAGWGTGFIRREPARQSTDLPFDLWNFGLTYRFDIPAQKYVGTIMFELQYVQKGFAYLESFDGTAAYARRLDVIELPILWQPYLPLGNKGSRIYLNAGPFLSYTLSSYEQNFDTETGEIKSEGAYEFDPNNDYYWNYGIAAGLGFYIAIGDFAITADGRYTIQLSDLMRGPESIVGNPFRTPVDHIGVSVGLQYKFSLGKR